MLVSTALSPSSPAAGAQSNNSCQMYVALATISVATGEAAAPTKEQQTADGSKETPDRQRSPSEGCFCRVLESTNVNIKLTSSSLII